MKNQEWSPAELKSKLEAYCAAAEHCESDARMRLRHWNCDSQTEDSIIDHLIEQNYISDERYAKAFVHDKLLYQGWGRVKIAYMLRAKKIAPQIIQSALETIDETEYFRILSHLISPEYGGLRTAHGYVLLPLHCAKWPHRQQPISLRQ